MKLVSVTVKHKNGKISKYAVLASNILHKTVRVEVSGKKEPAKKINIASGEDVVCSA